MSSNNGTELRVRKGREGKEAECGSGRVHFAEGSELGGADKSTELG